MLENFLPRVQYSVFEGWLTEPLLRRLRENAEAIVQPDKLDTLRIYQLCPHCVARTEVTGEPPLQAQETFVVV